MKTNKNKVKKIYRIYPGLEAYQKAAKKVFEKSIGLNKKSTEETMDGINLIQADGHDICNYVARYGIANFQIQSVLKLDGKLDFDKLVRAVRLSVDAEPVFGCQFIEDQPPYWKRFDNIDEITFCTLEETENPYKAIVSFLENPLDMDNDPMVKVRLIRTDQYDTLVVKLNHACCDGAGTKEYIQLLSDIYTNIDSNNNFIPEPSVRTGKDIDSLFGALGITNPDTVVYSLPKSPKPTWKFPWKKNQWSKKIHFVVCRLPNYQLDEMQKYAKSKGATINDLILTALYRAMSEISKPLHGDPMNISLTVDLRRYLPNNKTEAIRNLSGGIETKLAMIANESFTETLKRVMSVMNNIKSGYPGLENVFAARLVEKMSFKHFRDYYKTTARANELASRNPFRPANGCAPVLSNLGFLSKTLIKFGKRVVTDAYIIPPVAREPGFLLVACTYNNILTLAYGYYEASILKTDVKKLLDKIKTQLSEGCKQ